MNASALEYPVLHTLSALTLEGADARSFLQGQLSQDLRKLTPQRALLASCNSAQGRVQAVMTLLERDGLIIALLPGSMMSRLTPRLRNYVLRSKVTLNNDAARWSLVPLNAAQAATLSKVLPALPGEVVSVDSFSLMRWWSADERYLLLTPAAAVAAITTDDCCLNWRRADIAAGLPQVYPETHESFVAQMLNLDVLNGISFDKGCYTGQEIIARTHYRGTIKRRMLRFATSCASPAPGTRVVNGETPAGEVVEAVDTASGCELLAVISLEQAQAALTLQGVAGSDLRSLDLPYSLTAAAARDKTG